MHIIDNKDYIGVSALADLGMRQSGASGYALYEVDSESGALLVKARAGVPVPRPQDLILARSSSGRRDTAIISYSLRLEGSLIGSLVFAFHDGPVPEQRIRILDRLARVIESLYGLPHSATRLFERVNRIESELTMSKVVARVQGVLADSPENPDEKIQQIEEYVEKAARKWRLRPVLMGLLREAEIELSERKLAEKAKNLLQTVYGMSEEEAYHQLRNASRRTRRPIAQIAQNVIAETEPRTDPVICDVDRVRPSPSKSLEFVAAIQE